MSKLTKAQRTHNKMKKLEYQGKAKRKIEKQHTKTEQLLPECVPGCYTSIFNFEPIRQLLEDKKLLDINSNIVVGND